MIKLAIAGTSGLAQYIAYFVANQTSHQFCFLSRNPHPELTAKGWQVVVVDYNNASDLRFKVRGVDVVISTINGTPQMRLIDAAAAERVRRFIPSEFEGSPFGRPPNTFLDNGRRAALARLQECEAQGLRSTVFTCGIFYERFAPGGMAAFQIGVRSAIGSEGQYILDMRQGRAMIPPSDGTGRPVYVCLTSARDVARFVVAALSLPSWPREFRMRGERITIAELVSIGEQLRAISLGRQFERIEYTRGALQDRLSYARAVSDRTREGLIQHMIATADGRYDFRDPNLNSAVSITPQRFRDWLASAWSR